jgi:two-component system cell cycle sensor histidine kinase PleC
MKRRARTLYSADLPSSVHAALDAAGPAAAWAIDVTSGRILAANSSGRAALGLPDGDGTPPALDAATPALSLLREIAAAKDDTQVAALTFWTLAGAQKIQARIHVTRAGAQTLAVVTANPEAGATRAQSFVDFPGDDGATLKEIARCIRYGTSAADHPRRGGHVAAINQPGADVAVPHLATLAHELKTPLAAISAASEIIKDERFGPLGNARYAGYAADIHDSALHVLRLVDRLLDRGASGDDPAAGLDFVQLDMVSVLETLLSQLKPLAHDAGVTLTLDAAPKLPHVIADATAMRQIVLNLFSNALRHTDRGGTITIVARMRADGTVEMTLSDTGSGMTRAEANRLLRAAASANPNATAGRGIGLPLVASLAKANGAEFSLDSARGRGTSASIVFGRDRVVPV